MKLNETLLLKKKIEFSDVDAGGVLYHPNHIRVCDQVRNHYYDLAEYGFFKQKEQGFALAVAHCSSKFLKLIPMGNFFVATRLLEISKKTLHIKHAFYLCEKEALLANVASLGESLETSPLCAFVADFSLVAISYLTQRSCEIPEDFRRAMGF